jgi:pimeloyl-ACP methyl ester carboxylesterase
VPTLLCWGEQDRWVPLALGVAAAEVLPEATLVTVPDTGHAPYFERPGAFWAVVEPFLSSLDAPAVVGR